MTDYELGARRRLPMPAHLGVDAGAGLLLAAAPWVLGTARRGPREWLPGLLVGATEVVAAALTERVPGDRADGAATQRHQRPAAAGDGRDGHGRGHGRACRRPCAAGGHPAARDARSVRDGSRPARVRDGARRARRRARPPGARAGGLDLGDPAVAAALEEAGPEVRELVAEEALADRPSSDPRDERIAREEAAAAAEARAIGGPADRDAEDPAMEPVHQAGGGEQDGWELAERDLVENATHGDGGANPIRDAIAPEAESDRSPAVYGEEDHVRSSEVVDDPTTDDDDPGTGPGLTMERGPVQPAPGEH